MGACLSNSQKGYNEPPQIIQLKGGSKKTNSIDGEQEQLGEHIHLGQQMQSFKKPPNQKIDIEVQKILIEVFYLSGYLDLYCKNEQQITNQYKNVNKLFSTSQLQFSDCLLSFGISNNISSKIYQYITHKKNENNFDIYDGDRVDNGNISELNEMMINFKKGSFNQADNEYEITLSNITIKSFNPNKNEVILKIKGNCIKDYQQKNITPIMNNPLVILLGISEFNEIDCARLIGVKYDMIACRRLFELLYGYNVFPYRNHNKYGKQYWNSVDINNLFESAIKSELINVQNNCLINKFDAIIVVISTYIDNNKNIIYSSDEKAIHLQDIFNKFGKKYPKLIKIPRLFIIDGKRISISKNIQNMNRMDYKDNKEDDDDDMFIMNDNNQLHNVNNNNSDVNCMKLLHRSIRNEMNSSKQQEALFEDDGYSAFIKSMIKELKQYIYNDKYKHLHYTLSLNKIIENLRINIYKNGDLKLNKLKLQKRNQKYIIDINEYKLPPKVIDIPNDNKSKEFHQNLTNLDAVNNLLMDDIVNDMMDKSDNDNNNINPGDLHNHNDDYIEVFDVTPGADTIGDIENEDELMEQVTIVNNNVDNDIDVDNIQHDIPNDIPPNDILHEYSIKSKISVRIYRNKNGKIVNVSSMSTNELQTKLKQKILIEDLPLMAEIIDIKIKKNKKKINYSNTLYLVKLFSNSQKIWIKLRSICGKKCRSEIVYGSENKAAMHRYIKIKVVNASKTDYLKLLINDNDVYLEKCNFLVSPKYLTISPLMSHTYFIVGRIDRGMYNSKAETGVFGIIQFDLLSKSRISINTRILCAFRKQDKKNSNKDLQKPLISCNYLKKDKIKSNYFKKMIKKLNDSKPKNKERISCALNKKDPSHSVIYIFK